MRNEKKAEAVNVDKTIILFFNYLYFNQIVSGGKYNEAETESN